MGTGLISAVAVQRLVRSQGEAGTSGIITGQDSPIRYTFATLVTDASQYEALLQSLEAGGFGGADCEFLSIDNTAANAACAYRGLNRMLAAARGTFVVLCHQDVRLLADGREALEARLADLERMDPDWALAGNAGGVSPGVLAIRITDPHGADQNTGPLPVRVASLDENFIVVKRSARIGFSNDLTGFHFYGADICLQAGVAGYTAYVIDFHLAHLSAGRKSPAFDAMQSAFRAKWQRALAARWVQTTCSLVHLSGSPLGQAAGRLTEAPLSRISRRLSSARGWSKASR
ncbi:MAG: hypothetical protein ACT4N2_11880 [Hyphomicrobium sp.]